jgi:hypothetical protein
MAKITCRGMNDLEPSNLESSGKILVSKDGSRLLPVSKYRYTILEVNGCSRRSLWKLPFECLFWILNLDFTWVVDFSTGQLKKILLKGFQNVSDSGTGICRLSTSHTSELYRWKGKWGSELSQKGRRYKIDNLLIHRTMKTATFHQNSLQVFFFSFSPQDNHHDSYPRAD